MDKEALITGLRDIEAHLPYGAKTKIAKALRENKHNVQTAFRGLAGEKLMNRVWKKALALYPGIDRKKAA